MKTPETIDYRRVQRRYDRFRSGGPFPARREWHALAGGPLAIAARFGAICYLDEVVEARQDTTVVILPLTNDLDMRDALDAAVTTFFG